MVTEAIILSGGQGTRLSAVVADRAKPMAEVLERPFLEWLLLALRAQGIRRVVLATGHLADGLESYFKGSAPAGLELAFSREEKPLGTAGAARKALEFTQGPVVAVLNGDSYCPLDFKRQEQAHLQSGAPATLWLVPVDDCSHFGAVETDAKGNVAAFREKRAERRPGLINAGIYLFNRDTLLRIHEGRPISLEKEVFPELVPKGLHAVTGQGPFLDIGTPESYRLAAPILKVEFERLIKQKWKDGS